MLIVCCSVTVCMHALPTIAGWICAFAARRVAYITYTRYVCVRLYGTGTHRWQLDATECCAEAAAIATAVAAYGSAPLPSGS